VAIAAPLASCGTVVQRYRRTDEEEMAARMRGPDGHIDEGPRLLPLAPDGRVRPPRPVPPSVWALPDPDSGHQEDLIGFGADLAPATLVDAYRRGIFPWPHQGTPLPWFSPDPRGVMTAASLHVARSLTRTLRRCGWTTTVDADFAGVVAGCAARGGEGTWITAEMVRAYQRLHELGWAHSVEVWEGHELVGGIYGVQIGAVFTGESMFHRRTDASKAALVDLLDRFTTAGGSLLDVQLLTPHLATLGAYEVPRSVFLAELRSLGQRTVRMAVARRSVTLLAG
jgi:leucyl/phenylalanyl-tRNA---protein transferase